MSLKVHLVLYSNNEPYNTTKKLLIDTLLGNDSLTKYNVVIHNYDLEKIKKCDWFKYISNLPLIDLDKSSQEYPNPEARRDGYYNAWKPFIVKEVYDIMEEDDILYYVDCSRHYISGFNENIDKLIEITKKCYGIAGSIGNDILNKSLGYADNIKIWDTIIKYRDNSVYLDKMHVLNSWFLFKKCDSNDSFINDWVYFSCYKDEKTNHPLVVFHHTGDQGIFNILVVKYNKPVFYHKNIGHNQNKDKNLVLNIINNTDNIKEYIINF
jgi:hypothetical protein